MDCEDHANRLISYCRAAGLPAKMIYNELKTNAIKPKFCKVLLTRSSPKTIKSTFNRKKRNKAFFQD
jgi:transglutaminase-like putative cysteine protease